MFLRRIELSSAHWRGNVMRALFVVLTLFGVIVGTAPVQAADGVPDCSGCPPMIAIPAGSFWMGLSDEEFAWASGLGAPEDRLKTELPRHRVDVKPFWMSATEVTRDQFEAFVRATGYVAKGACLVTREAKEVLSGENDWRNPGHPQGGDHPVVCVSWVDATAYTKWLSDVTGKPYRLPSEAEWEYAARAGTETGRHWGWNDADACRFANVNDATSAKERLLPPSFACNDGYAWTAPVAHFQSNPFGLFDMMGNVLEWTEDCHHDSYNGAPRDGSVWTRWSCKVRVLRSSSAGARSWAVRSAHRGTGDVGGKFAPVGFRVARSE